MAEELDSIVLRYLRAIDQKLDRMMADVLELKTRVGILEQQYASISNRIDRIEGRLDRIVASPGAPRPGDPGSVPDRGRRPVRSSSPSAE